MVYCSSSALNEILYTFMYALLCTCIYSLKNLLSHQATQHTHHFRHLQALALKQTKWLWTIMRWKLLHVSKCDWLTHIHTLTAIIKTSPWSNEAFSNGFVLSVCISSIYVCTVCVRCKEERINYLLLIQRQAESISFFTPHIKVSVNK